jgi:hypothetical protein
VPTALDVVDGEVRELIRRRGLGPEESWWPTGDEARADFERLKTELMQGDGSGLFKLSLYVDGELTDEDFVVRALPNRLECPQSCPQPVWVGHTPVTTRGRCLGPASC